MRPTADGVDVVDKRMHVLRCIRWCNMQRDFDGDVVFDAEDRNHFVQRVTRAIQELDVFDDPFFIGQNDSD